MAVYYNEHGVYAVQRDNYNIPRDERLIMHKLLDVPNILKEFDPKLTVRERGRLAKHGGKYSDIMAHLRGCSTERETQMFLYHELTQPVPRDSVLDRLCGMLHRAEARRKRAELFKIAQLPARKRY
jgi:predicted alpha/beta-fold hydrolase